MMMPGSTMSTWAVLTLLVGLAMLAVAGYLAWAMYRRPPAAPPHDLDVGPGSAPQDSPEARAARGEMDRDQLRREQGRQGPR